MRSADDWNEFYQPGQPVIYTDDFGEEHQTNTRSVAWEVCGTAVVSLEGKSGGYDLDRVKPMETH